MFFFHSVPLCLCVSSEACKTALVVVNILDDLATNRHALRSNEPAEPAPRAIKALKATNVAGGTKRVRTIPIQAPRKMQSIAKRPSPSRSPNKDAKAHPIGSPTKFAANRSPNKDAKVHPVGSPTNFATKNMSRLTLTAGANYLTPKFALKSIRR